MHRVVKDPTGQKTRILLGPPFHRHWQGAAGCSIKAYVAGSVPFRVERQVCLVGDHAYIFVNSGQDYEFRTPAQSGIFNMTIFLSDADARDAWGSIRRPELELLDNPLDHCADPDFFVTPLRPTPEVRTLQEELRGRAMSGKLPADIRHALTADLVQHMLHAQSAAMGQTWRVRAARRSTREEVVRRVRRAVDAIESDIAQPLDLDALAGLACMAKHHFLRRFRDVTGETPHQFILQRRLARARDLLAKDIMTAAEIGRACGFSDASGFSSAFRAAHGLPPRAWRRRRNGAIQPVRDPRTDP
jgi:AraC family transcriptional regulator